jgi:pimeloyl-ACP methyl ester carboxylesterase
MSHIQVDDVELEYEVRGVGEPVLLVPLSVFIDGLARPLFGQPRLCSNHRLIHYHRRGWSGSSRGHGPLSVARQAADAAALLKGLRIERAHVVGHSYGGVIALQLALDEPELVGTVALLEPALRAGPEGRAHLERTIGPARARYGEGDKRAFVTVFIDGVFGPGWEPTVERALPGAIEQAVADADTFFEEQPALLQWNFGPEQAAAITQPVLSVLGSRSAAIFREGRTVLHSWLAQTEDLDVDASHMLQIEDPAAIAAGLAGFWNRHPL